MRKGLKKSIRAATLVVILGISVPGGAFGAGAAKEKTVQFAVTVAGIMGHNEVKGDFSHLGPGVRVDVLPTKWLMISPEISYLSGWNGGLSLGGTVNGRLGKGYIGLGFLSLRQTTAVYFAPQTDELSALWKAHVGLKGRHWLIAFSAFTDSLSDPWIHGLGLTAGYVF